jgi:hypothetical protein
MRLFSVPSTLIRIFPPPKSHANSALPDPRYPRGGPAGLGGANRIGMVQPAQYRAVARSGNPMLLSMPVTVTKSNTIKDNGRSGSAAPAGKPGTGTVPAGCPEDATLCRYITRPAICQRTTDTQPGRAGGAHTEDTLSRWHDPYGNVTAGIHGTTRRAGSPSAAASDPLPWGARTQRQAAIRTGLIHHRTLLPSGSALEPTAFLVLRPPETRKHSEI